MQNPFEYSNFVTGSSFCNRQIEQGQLLEFIKASQNVLIYSHRRTGKSSLIKQVFQNIEEQNINIATLYIDLYGTTSDKDFITRAFQQLNSLESNTDKLFGLLKNSISKLSFQLSFDPGTNTPAISPSFKAADEKLVLKNLMDLFAKFSEKKRIVVVFDEFQEIAKYTNAGTFEKLLRSYIQQHSNISYIFSGSQQHVLTRMFSSKERAFYQQAASFPLKKIEVEHYVPWLKQVFEKGNITIEEEDLKQIVEQFENHPMYIQLFCFFLWEELKHSAWDANTIAKIERSIIGQKHLEYQTLWDNLSINQKKTLKLVFSNDGEKLFSAKSLMEADVKTASIVTRCLNSLVEKEILVKNGKYFIQDILFRKWLSFNVIE